MDDFQNLAQIATPRMMPNAPIGAGFTAGYDYNQQQQRQQGYLDQAANSASVKARMDAMEAEEKTAGHQGRLDDLALKGTMSQDALADSDTSVQAARAERKNKVGKAEVENMKNEIGKLSPYLNAWEKADPDQKVQFLQIMKEQGAKFGNTVIGDLPIEKADMLMKSLRQAQANDPKFHIEEMKAATKLVGVQDTNRTHAQIAQAKEALAVKLKQMGIANDTDKKKVYEKLLALKAVGKLDEQQAETLNLILEHDGYAAAMRGALAPPQATIAPGGKLNMGRPAPAAAPRVTADVPTPDAPAPTAAPKAGPKDYATIAKEQGLPYDPKQFDYRVDPKTGKLQRMKKGK